MVFCLFGFGGGGGMGQLAHGLVATIFDDFFFKFYLFCERDSMCVGGVTEREGEKES